MTRGERGALSTDPSESLIELSSLSGLRDLEVTIVASCALFTERVVICFRPAASFCGLVCRRRLLGREEDDSGANSPSSVFSDCSLLRGAFVAVGFWRSGMLFAIPVLRSTVCFSLVPVLLPRLVAGETMLL